MTDIVGRLRNARLGQIGQDAADEIERLREAVRAEREAVLKLLREAVRGERADPKADRVRASRCPSLRWRLQIEN